MKEIKAEGVLLSNDNHDNETEYLSEGGIIRQSIKHFTKIKKSYLRSIAKHSDKLSDISDVVIKVSNTVNDKDIDNANSNSKSNVNVNGNGKGNVSYNINDDNNDKKFSRIIRNLPAISTKDWLLMGTNIMIGSLSFYPYENNVFNSLILNGIIGGAVSGVFTTMSDKVIMTRTRRKYVGTILSHAISFSALFTSYEFSKGTINSK